jgi:hypothetical protein
MKSGDLVPRRQSTAQEKAKVGKYAEIEAWVTLELWIGRLRPRERRAKTTGIST